MAAATTTDTWWYFQNETGANTLVDLLTTCVSTNYSTSDLMARYTFDNSVSWGWREAGRQLGKMSWCDNNIIFDDTIESESIYFFDMFWEIFDIA